ncbi:AraC family transcriptional regulator N-terminal domain-containing protein [Deinococcus yunweiensis]|uniref:AraC family transcriptional regulator n=1 Tax=Deinococcus yunweiensis TaxID=367282 RepID=UPI00398F1CE0
MTGSATGSAAPVARADAGVERLRTLILQHAPYDAEFALRVEGVSVARATRTHDVLVHSVQRPALCVVVQGSKTVYVGAEQYEYNPQRMLLYTVNLPIAFQVTQASGAEPFLTFKLDLDPQRIAELALRLYPHGLPRAAGGRGVQVMDVTDRVVSAAIRLLEAVQDEREARWIGPLVVEELLIRLLLSPAGALVAQLGQVESNTQRVARAIEWIQAHFDEPLNIEALASTVHMGVSTLHAHFKAVTSMSPLQFQKHLRLQEARRLMVTTTMDAGTAGRQVGYASASQFTREYTRLFGSTPRRDIAHFRDRAMTLEPG